MGQRNTRLVLILLAFVVVFLFYLTFSIALYPSAQSNPANPTEQRQIVNTVVQSRFVQTALFQVLQTAQGTIGALYASATSTPHFVQVILTSTADIKTMVARATQTVSALPPRDLTATAVMEITVDNVLKQDLTATAMPVRLVSDKFLDDTSLLSEQPCSAPCFDNITVGKTTFADALKILKSDPNFSDLYSTDDPPAAGWSTAGDVVCCQLTADAQTKLVDAIVVKLNPKITSQQLINKYGEPTYDFPVDFSTEEVSVAYIYPKVGIVVWTVPGNAQSTLKGTDPVVIVLYFDPKTWETKYLATAYIQKWNGYLPYQTYRSATPIVTPRVTPTLP